MEQIEISVVLYQEEDRWIAQGLEFDITARGSSPVEASQRFFLKVGAELIMSLELGDETPLSTLGTAPQKFWEMFQNAPMRVDTDEKPIRLTNSNVARVRPQMKISDYKKAA